MGLICDYLHKSFIHLCRVPEAPVLGRTMKAGCSPLRILSWEQTAMGSWLPGLSLCLSHILTHTWPKHGWRWDRILNRDAPYALCSSAKIRVESAGWVSGSFDSSIRRALCSLSVPLFKSISVPAQHKAALVSESWLYCYTLNRGPGSITGVHMPSPAAVGCVKSNCQQKQHIIQAKLVYDTIRLHVGQCLSPIFWGNLPLRFHILCDQR